MAELYAGYGETILNPPMGVELAGYGYYLNRRAESVLDDLKARAIWLGDGANDVLLISCDLIGFTVEFSDAIRKAIASEIHIPREHILLACTHTHTGPASMPLDACGEVSPEYLETLPAAIAEAARRARADRQSATMRALFETVMPIGINRRLQSFETIDPVAKIAVLERKKEKLYIVNYACHPVTLGPVPAVSADWPGAVVAAIERRGHRGVVFQGFCGDIDPVCFANRWGKGTPEMLTVYGEAIDRQICLAEQYANPVEIAGLKGVEKRIRLSLQVPDLSSIQREKQYLLAQFKKAPGTMRAIETWAEEAAARRDSTAVNPWLENVPIQKIAVGDVAFIGLPGEVFTAYSLKLRKQWPTLFTIGYAGGCEGYIPTAQAYHCADDYACYQAPKLYRRLFPFAPRLEEDVLRACGDLLAGKRR
ncbi:MAG: hypothetical protein PHW60_03825 [Kiritimatiellae bacterium]|nr:hypothetical protein [Kiritimatiellia bacterium]